MKSRLNFNKVQPAAYVAMDALDEYVNNTAINPLHKELIRIRASQINGCAFCVNMHSADALKLGETQQRVILVSAWREAGNIFTEEERLLFAMTEEMSLIHLNGLSDATYQQAVDTWGEEQTAQIMMIIVTVKAWNMIGVATQLRPAPVRSAQKSIA